MRHWDEVFQFLHRLANRETTTFLSVGAAGYVVDVAAFNLLRSAYPLDVMDPVVARVLAVIAAICVTYVGNRMLTWRGHRALDRRREVALFVVFNVVGLGFSLVCLVVSHDLLGMTSRLADNVSANGVGLALGTMFRYVTYKRFVFAVRSETADRDELRARGSRKQDQGRVPSAKAGAPGP